MNICFEFLWINYFNENNKKKVGSFQKKKKKDNNLKWLKKKIYDVLNLPNWH